MDPKDQALIEQFAREYSKPVNITLVTDDSPQTAELSAFCDELAGLAPNVAVKREAAEDGPAPVIRTAANLSFQAVPQKRELPPFLAALQRTGQGLPPISDEAGAVLWELATPALFSVYMTPFCPHCSKVVEKLISAALVSPLVYVNVIDGSLFVELAKENQIRSAPTVILDGGPQWVGETSLTEMLTLAVNRDVTQLGTDSLRTMLSGGEAQKLSAMMAREGKVFPAFVKLLADPKWPARLGAMVAFEYLVQASPDLARAVVVPLWERFFEVEEKIQGDILHTVGESGRTDLISSVEKVVEGKYPAEVREAAQEALEKLRG